MDCEMNRNLRPLIWLPIVVAVGLTVQTGGAAPIYENDFSSTEIGQVPNDFLVLDGQFAVREFEGNRVLELPGTPLETYGVLFGPAARHGQSVYARVHSTHRGRRFPAFAVSLGGVSGFRLEVAAAKQTLELLQGEQTIETVPWEWASGAWTHLRLQIRQLSEQSWIVEGKAWVHGTPEPSDWTITLTRSEEPIPGRSGIWGKPFSGTPIRYDDLKVERIESNRAE